MPTQRIHVVGMKPQPAARDHERARHPCGLEPQEPAARFDRLLNSLLIHSVSSVTVLRGQKTTRFLRASTFAASTPAIRFTSSIDLNGPWSCRCLTIAAATSDATSIVSCSSSAAALLI